MSLPLASATLKCRVTTVSFSIFMAWDSARESAYSLGSRDFPYPMTDSPISETAAQPAPTPASASKPKAAKPRDAAFAVLEKLFQLYPKMFGARFLPLKLGVYQELLALHPDDFKKEDLKVALGVHARSTRYLEAVAA